MGKSKDGRESLYPYVTSNPNLELPSNIRPRWCVGRPDITNPLLSSSRHRADMTNVNAVWCGICRRWIEQDQAKDVEWEWICRNGCNWHPCQSGGQPCDGLDYGCAAYYYEPCGSHIDADGWPRKELDTGDPTPCEVIMTRSCSGRIGRPKNRCEGWVPAFGYEWDNTDYDAAFGPFPCQSGGRTCDVASSYLCLWVRWCDLPYDDDVAAKWYWPNPCAREV